MSDLINRSALIEAIKQRMKLHEKDAENLADDFLQRDSEELFLRLADECQVIVELIEEQPKVSEWIPVEERLPKIGEQVMVCNRYGSVFVSAITYINAKVLSTGECHDFGKHYGVVAWMPLPAPYDMRKKVEE